LEALVLSYFDNKIGPTISHAFNLEGISAPVKLPPNIRTEIVKLIDMQTTEEFFTYGFENYASANLYFEIHSDWARGNRELLCLSILLHFGKPELFKETLIGGAQRLKAIPNLFKAFHGKPKDPDPEIQQKQLELKELLTTLCQEINHAREKGITPGSTRENQRNRVRDQKRDRDRDEARDRNRDEVRDRDRDEVRDRDRDAARDRQRDDAR
jgi:hypothetical protein